MRVEKKDDFRDTRPLREHQERLHAQWGRPRPHYVPNHVPAAARLMYALISLTWVAWALIGLLSGHMFFFLAVPIHFSGWPAIVFSLAVLTSAAACAIAIVDHYDRRDNEKAYRRLRKRLWWAALAGWVAAAAIGFAEAGGWLPYTDGQVGLLSTERINALLAFGWLKRLLFTYGDRFPTWSGITAVWCLLGLILMAKLGLLQDEAQQPRTGGWLIAIMSMILPALVTFALLLADDLASGHIVSWAGHEDEFRANRAWLQSLLLTTLGATALFLLVLILIVLRELGILPPLQQPILGSLSVDVAGPATPATPSATRPPAGRGASGRRLRRKPRRCWPRPARRGSTASHALSARD